MDAQPTHEALQVAFASHLQAIHKLSTDINIQVAIQDGKYSGVLNMFNQIAYHAQQCAIIVSSLSLRRHFTKADAKQIP